MTTKWEHGIHAIEYINAAQRSVGTLARELELLVRDLRVPADHLAGTVAVGSPSTPTSVASDIVGLYLNRTGNGSVRLSELVFNAGKAEAHRASIPTTDTITVTER